MGVGTEARAVAGAEVVALSKCKCTGIAEGPLSIETPPLAVVV